jgi:acetylornithine deacetylase
VDVGREPPANNQRSQEMTVMPPALSDRDLLARLVAFDSTSRYSNRPIAEFICDYLDGPGVTILRNASDDGEKVNLIVRVASRGDSGDASGLILSGHMDVVPAEEPQWRSNPFTLTETADSYIARGAADMKGFVALAINLAREAAAGAAPLSAPLVLLLTFDEELGLLGAQHFQRTWRGEIPLPRNAIIGEPTELRVVRLHKGHLKMRITLGGVPAHSAYPHLGRSAIEPAGRIIVAMSALRTALEAERCETSIHFPQTPFVTLNVATIHGGSAVNIIPDRCVLEVGARVLPGMDSKMIIDRVRAAVLAVDDLPECTVEVTNDGPPLHAPADCAVHSALCRIIGQAGDEAVSYASDAGVFQQMGIDSVLYGPGTIEVAHKPNESLPKAEFVEARRVLERVIGEFCRTSR